MGTGVSVGHGVMMSGKVVTAVGGYCLQLMIYQKWVHLPGETASAIEGIFRIG